MGATNRTWLGAQSIPVLALGSWRGGRGSCGSLWGSRAAVILHRFVGCLLGVILWIGLAEIRNFRINHAEFSNLLQIAPTASV